MKIPKEPVWVEMFTFLTNCMRYFAYQQENFVVIHDMGFKKEFEFIMKLYDPMKISETYNGTDNVS